MLCETYTNSTSPDRSEGGVQSTLIEVLTSAELCPTAFCNRKHSILLTVAVHFPSLISKRNFFSFFSVLIVTIARRIQYSSQFCDCMLSVSNIFTATNDDRICFTN